MGFHISLSPIRTLGSSFYASGQVAMGSDGVLTTGLAGQEVDLGLAQECTWQCVLNVLTSVQKALGSLNKIACVVRLGIYVASADGFTDQHLVAHGASQVILFRPPRSGCHFFISFRI
jgi:enamine deaminase RidA (YjgF/YER057c/UK114 family)